MPVLAVTAVGKELEKRDARYLGLACRIAAEFGAHFVKTYFCEDFSKVVESCPVPLVVAVSILSLPLFLALLVDPVVLLLFHSTLHWTR